MDLRSTISRRERRLTLYFLAFLKCRSLLMILLTVDTEHFIYLATVPKLKGFSFTINDLTFAILISFFVLPYIFGAIFPLEAKHSCFFACSIDNIIYCSFRYIKTLSQWILRTECEKLFFGKCKKSVFHPSFLETRHFSSKQKILLPDKNL